MERYHGFPDATNIHLEIVPQENRSATISSKFEGLLFDRDLANHRAEIMGMVQSSRLMGELSEPDYNKLSSIHNQTIENSQE